MRLILLDQLNSSGKIVLIRYENDGTLPKKRFLTQPGQKEDLKEIPT